MDPAAGLVCRMPSGIDAKRGAAPLMALPLSEISSYMPPQLRGLRMDVADMKYSTRSPALPRTTRSPALPNNYSTWTPAPPRNYSARSQVPPGSYSAKSQMLPWSYPSRTQTLPGVTPRGRGCPWELLRTVAYAPSLYSAKSGLLLRLYSSPLRLRGEEPMELSRRRDSSPRARLRCARIRQTSVAKIGAASRRAQANTAQMCRTLHFAVLHAACCRVAYSAALSSVAALHVSCSQRRP